MGRWFRIWYSFFRLGPKFAVLPVWRFFGPKITISNFFRKIENFWIFLFCILKENKIVGSLQKKIIEIGPTVPEISHLEAEKLSKFHDFFQIFFIFTVNLTLDLKMKKKIFERMQFFIRKPKISYDFFYECSFSTGGWFYKNW